MNDTAASLQQEYDEACHLYGPFSPEAQVAHMAATFYFKDTSCKSAKQNAVKQSSASASPRQVVQARPTARS